MPSKAKISGAAHNVIGGVAKINGVSYKIKKGRTLVSGTGYDILFQSAVAGKALAEYTEGDVVRIPENGVDVEFYVAEHNYEDAANGSGKTLLVRKEGYRMMPFDISTGTYGCNAYATSDLYKFTNNEYKNLFTSGVMGKMQTVKIPYTPGNGVTTVSALDAVIFSLSLREYGKTVSNVNREGTPVPIADKLLQLTFGGNAVGQSTRTPDNDTNVRVYAITATGGVVETPVKYEYCLRPAFCFLDTEQFDPETNKLLL